ncbi:hypothetical protein D3C73_1076590 [compost metagenome]
MNHRGLADAIGQMRIPGVADARDGRHRDDRPAALLAHQRRQEARGDQQAGHVHLLDAVPVVQRNVFRPAHLADARIGLQDVDTPIAAQRGVHRGLHGVRVSHVRLHGQGAAARQFDLVRGVFGGGKVHVQRHHRRAFARQRHAACAADAPAGGRRTGAGHQGDLARQARAAGGSGGIGGSGSVHGCHAELPPFC